MSNIYTNISAQWISLSKLIRTPVKIIIHVKYNIAHVHCTSAKCSPSYLISALPPHPPPLPQCQPCPGPGCWKYSAPYRHQLKATIKEKQKELSEANSFLDLALSYFNFNPAEVSRQRSVLELDDTAHTLHRASLSLFFSRRPAAARWRPAGPGLQTFLPHLQSHFVTSSHS